MLSFFLTIFITYFVTTLFGYLIHWSLHQSFTGKFNQAHMTHHLKLYPPSDFMSDFYRDPGKDNTVIIFGIAAIPIILGTLLLGIFGIFSWFIVITALFVEASMGFLHDYVHDAFHINKHWLSTTPFVKDIFHKWWKLHYIHHIKMESNYGIFVFHWDKVFKTFCQKS